MQMTKTSVGHAFSDIRGTPNPNDPLDKNYFHARVGFTTINYTGTNPTNSEFLEIKNFDQQSQNHFL